MRHGWITASVLLGAMVAGCGGTTGRPTTTAVDQAAVTTDPASAAPARPVRPAAAARAAKRGAPPPAHPIPASFRESGISPGAPSDSQVRAELQQMYAVQAHARKLSAAAANFAGLLPWVDEQKSGEMVSVASVFTDYGLGLACGGVLGRLQIGVAHKTAPCGTLIDFTYAGRTLRVPVIDRGPYIVGREWDLTGATAEALGFPGLGGITWRCASC
ncbi:MAG TPA: septal ring lytic transglycosylase RlpA family protein [Solirubrobacteraceae bacterium]|nr:septal ring lytic transglycosylase RlpA family protein [Solirubrobacteraceae bacterium]